MDARPSATDVTGSSLPGNSDFLYFLDQWNHSQGLSTPALHVEIASWLDQYWRGDTPRALLQVFRGAGKSTLIGLFCAWLLSSDPNHRILVLSADQALACKMTRNVRRVLETLDAGLRKQGRRNGEWAADRLTVTRTALHRDPSLLARGVDCIVTGSRADLIVCDDVEVPATCETPLKRQNLRAALRELNFVLVPSGRLLYAGTPHSYYSIYAEEARLEVDEDQPFLASYLRLTVPVLRDGKSAWPERFTLEQIDRLHAESGPLMFRSQMMLEPIDPRRVRLDPDDLIRYQGQLVAAIANGVLGWSINGNTMRAQACWWDPALARDQRADGSVVAMMLEDFAGKLWLHEVNYMTTRRMSGAGPDEVMQLSQQLCDFVRRNHVLTIHVESNGQGEIHCINLRTACQRAGLQVAVIARAHTKNKSRRILEAFDPTLAARRLHVHESVWDTPFIQEMRSWQVDGRGHDDGLDAVGACIDLLPPRPAAAAGQLPRLRLRAGQIYQARTEFNPW